MIEHEVSTAKGRIHVNEYPGEGPAIVMTHGFPDDSRIYDRLIPELAGRRAVTFDFLGHGRSGREAIWPLESGQREGELAAIVDALGIEKPVLVGHDIGGPVVIRYALANPGRVGGMVLSRLDFPVTIAFGADDPYMNAGVAQHLHSIFGKSVLKTIPNAAHWPQWDQPAATAAVITAI